MDGLSDEKLVADSRAGNKGAYAVLIKRHYRQVLLVCLGMLGNIHDAEDIAQDALLKGFIDIRKLRRSSKFGPWLTKIARNLCINHLRRKKRATEIYAQTQPAPENEIADTVPLQRAIARLPQDIRMPVVMHFLGKKPVKGIAEEMSISPSGVYAKLRKGLRLLHDMLSEHGDTI